MIELQTAIEGKKTYFGQMRKLLKPMGYTLCGNWEYDRAFFDGLLWRDGGETIYIRIPFHVLDGELDNDDTFIEFGTPYVIKHVVHIGLDRDADSLLLTAAGGLNQFQEPLDRDGYIKDKSEWEDAGKQAIEYIMDYI
ncbi:hypothetical protein KFZ58_17730 [Virgibacillus sp. NKC19-16]|uniref:YugN family protein n=1 Tax=Virgibacillus salidurans TaxID=2831673 RepID=UPI001F273927|nr:YugN family protein [Virgibacillus sp. NKC19-16]UJL46172.1 hypothetical protein KFZ58_17730 [Virgibacillus sp. NKC19-16]